MYTLTKKYIGSTLLMGSFREHQKERSQTTCLCSYFLYMTLFGVAFNQGWGACNSARAVNGGESLYM